METARHFARQGRVDQAREALVAADDLQPGLSSDYRVLALKAGLEIKADQPHAARAFLEQAQEALAEPAALWLVMALEATRLELPEQEGWLYEKRWHDALKRRCRSETAGRMCSILNDQFRSPESQEFDEQDEQYSEPLLKYVRRCSRVKWDLEDLRHVCQFLDATGDDHTLKKVLKRGLRSFPEAAYLHWFAAKMELDKGSLGCHRRRCKGHLCETIRLAAASEDPRDRDLAERAQRARTLLEAGRLHHYHDADDREYGLDEQKVTDFLDQLEGIPPEIIRRLVEDACESLDMDPEEIMEEIERRQTARTRRRS
jgi:hypothetical protein